MREACGNVYNGCKIPFLIRRFQVSSTSPVDGYGGLCIIPYVILTLIKGILGPDFQPRGGWNGNLGFRGGFDCRNLRLVAYFDADDCAEFSTLSEATDEAVAEDVCKAFVVHLWYGVEGHLVGDR